MMKMSAVMSGLRCMIFAGIVFFGYAVPVGASETPRFLILGDSLTAGYGLLPDQVFAVRLKEALHKFGADVEISNASVSGDTTAAGLARLDWALAGRPTHVMVELGANDMLRGLDPIVTRVNLDKIITELKNRRIQVMLAGMYAAPNLGRRYAQKFAQIYSDLANKHQILLYPFFLSGVAADPGLNLADGMHPNQNGIQVIIDRILPTVVRFLGMKE